MNRADAAQEREHWTQVVAWNERHADCCPQNLTLHPHDRSDEQRRRAIQHDHSDALGGCAMKVIVTGSRTLDATGCVKVYEALDALLLEAGQLDVSVGDCPTGADYYARRWAKRSIEAWPSGTVRLKVYGAEWERLGLRAGPARNARMVADGADLCIAFYQPGAASKGTAGCVALARKARIKVHEYTGDPS